MAFQLFRKLERRFGGGAAEVSRRDFLRSTAAIGAGMLLGPRGSCGAVQAVGKRVAIIGGGFAGLSAALELQNAGYEVSLIEARLRVGGRVETSDRFVLGKTVELGGEMVGANHPVFLALAQRFGVQLREIVYDKDAESPILFDGERLNPGAARRLWREMKEALSKMNDDAKAIDPYQPWTSPNAAELDRRSTADWIKGLKISDQCKRAISIQLTAINGVLPAWQSYLGNLAMVKGGGLENYWTQTDFYHSIDGNQLLAEEMSDEIGGESILLNTSATAISAKETGVVVTLSDGREVETDDVILAVPCSTWNRISFSPTLPAALTPQMGNNTKFQIAVKQRFWEAEQLSPRSLTDGPIHLTWEDTNGQPGENGACLTVYAGGPAADQAVQWKEERPLRYLEILDRLYPGINQQVVKTQFIDWRNDPLARGSYSFPAPGQVTTIGPLLDAGLGRIHFAGEHCCPAFVGYMEGALQSGVRLAKKLAKRDGVVLNEGAQEPNDSFRP